MQKFIYPKPANDSLLDMLEWELSASESGKWLVVIIGVACGSAFLLIIAVCIAVVCVRIRRRKRPDRNAGQESNVSHLKLQIYLLLIVSRSTTPPEYGTLQLFQSFTTNFGKLNSIFQCLLWAAGNWHHLCGLLNKGVNGTVRIRKRRHVRLCIKRHKVERNLEID